MKYRMGDDELKLKIEYDKFLLMTVGVDEESFINAMFMPFEEFSKKHKDRGSIFPQYMV